jgi:hypothetical protein
MNEYRAANGAHFGNEEAQRYGERIEKLELQYRDAPNIIDLIIEDAKKEDSPLHDAFEWDDEMAAESYRKHQAQILLCDIEVKIINPRSEEEEYIRAFHPIKVITSYGGNGQAPETGRTWTTTYRILNDEELHAQLIDKAWRELESWQMRYRQYLELQPMINLLQDAKKSRLGPLQ